MKQVNKVIMIGADPELFVKNNETGKLVSAHDLIPGTKDNPFPVLEGAIQVDGLAAEFNIKPCLGVHDFVNRNNVVISELKKKLGNKYSLVIEPVAFFDNDYFTSLPQEVKTLGCNDDFDAWRDGAVNPKPDGTVNQRTAAGHLHGSWGKSFDPFDEDHFADCCMVAREADYYVGIYSLMWDANQKRRAVYGKAGAMRPKKYGVEYRTPSNKWLSSQILTSFVFNQFYSAINSLLNGNKPLSQKYGNLAQEVINNGIKWWEEPKHPFHSLSNIYNLGEWQYIKSNIDTAWSAKPKIKTNPKHMYDVAV